MGKSKTPTVPREMYALYSEQSFKQSGYRAEPLGIFHSKWKAKDAFNELWNIKGKPILKAVRLEQPREVTYKITTIEYKIIKI